MTYDNLAACVLDLHKAHAELSKKSIEQIERDTALTWGGRAAAAYGECQVAKDPQERLRWLWDAENYRQEAIEHAAMVEDLAFLAELKEEVDQHREDAHNAMTLPGTRGPAPRSPASARKGTRPRARGQPARSAPPVQRGIRS